MLAVTTCFFARSARRISSRAKPVPPTSSITVSTSGSSSAVCKSVSNSSFGRPRLSAWVKSRSTMYFKYRSSPQRSRRPARSSIKSPATLPPTVPQPTRACALFCTCMQRLSVPRGCLSSSPTRLLTRSLVGTRVIIQKLHGGRHLALVIIL